MILSHNPSSLFPQPTTIPSPHHKNPTHSPPPPLSLPSYPRHNTKATIVGILSEVELLPHATLSPSPRCEVDHRCKAERRRTNEELTKKTNERMKKKTNATLLLLSLSFIPLLSLSLDLLLLPSSLICFWLDL